MEFITSKSVSEKWGISQRRVCKLCTDGRIAEAKRVGRQWMIPSNVKKPVDGRKLRYAKTAKKAAKK